MLANIGRRRFLSLLEGLSDQSVWRKWVANQPVPVRGEQAITAVLNRI